MSSHVNLLNIAVALWIMPWPAFGQGPQVLPLDKYLISFEHIPSPSFGRINAIIRDDRGFIWFGTTSGLCKYDGYQVRVQTAGTPPDVLQQLVTGVIKMGDGSLLLGSGKGLWTFDPRTEQSAPFLPGARFSETRVNALVQDSRGTIWIGTDSLGLFGYDPGTLVLRRYTSGDGLSNDVIMALLPDRRGNLWIGTVAGLDVLDVTTSRISSYHAHPSDPASLQSDNITALYESDSGELWVGSRAGLDVLEESTGRIRRMDLHSYIRHTVGGITKDAANRMWIGASDLGLLTYYHGTFEQFSTLSDVERTLGAITALYPDPVATSAQELLLWIGTRSGVNKILVSKNPFANHIRNRDSLQLGRGAVLSLYEDRKGTLWAGLWGGGLDALRRSNGTYRLAANFQNDPSNPVTLPDNDVESILEDRTGILWLGTFKGLAALDNQRSEMVIDTHREGDSTSIASNRISRIYEDHSGTIWVCTNRGFSQLVRSEAPPEKGGQRIPHRFRNYLDNPSDNPPEGGTSVDDIIEDEASNHWVATSGRGLYRLGSDGTLARFVFPGDSTGVGKSWIYALTEDRNGLIWLSTGRGLVSFDPRTGSFAQVSPDQFQNAHIFGIAADAAGDLWLSTGVGLVKYSPKTQAFMRYDKDDGMPFTELLSGFFRSRRGTLYVGGLDGFTEFCPESVVTASRPPEISITAFSVFGKELSASAVNTGEIRLGHDQNFFSFSFAALDYVKPLRNRFTYRMVGVDKGWIDAGTRNYASYTNVNPGDYVFQVKGCNSDEVWNESGASISIVITPPFWQTWWFRILAAGLGGGAIYAAYRYRLRRLLEVERLRLRIADDLHDDVGSNLSTIAIVSRAVQQAPELTPGTRSKLSEIYDTAVTTSEGMKDIVWFIKPRNDTLDDLLLRMKDTASALLREIGHDFETSGDENSMKVTIEFKRNYFLAFKEILTNIVKHASATRVQIQVEDRDGMLETVIHDNGCGFDQSSAGAVRRGNGLGSLKNRARNIRGEFEITSQPGRGTSVRFSGRL